MSEDAEAGDTATAAETADSSASDQRSSENSSASDHRLDDASTADETATSFLELESALGVTPTGDSSRGQAVGVERVPAKTVPDDYPVDIQTAEAIELTVAVDDRTEVVYFSFADGQIDERLSRLLALKELSAGQFGDLYGESIHLTVEDGHHLPVVPQEPLRGDQRGVYGVVTVLAVNLVVLLLAVAGVGWATSTWAVAALVCANVLCMPTVTYLDAWYLRTHTDWDGGPLFWAFLGSIPGVNLLSSLAYLRQRAGATAL